MHATSGSKIKFTIITFVSLLISLPTIFLMQDVTKYPLYIFEASIILLLAYFISNDKFIKVGIFMPNLFFDYLFVMLSISLLFLNICNVYSPANIILSLIVSSFLPGYVILRLMNFNCLYSHIEIVVLSYAFSLPLTSFISAVLLSMAEETRALAICLVYLIMSFLLIIRAYGIGKKGSKINEKHRYSELNILSLALMIMILFLPIFSISAVYPESCIDLPFAAADDILQNWRWSRLISLNRNYTSSPYASSPYPLFSIYESTIFISSKANIFAYSTFQTILAFQGVIFILSLYIMANAYLKNVNKNLPMIATLFLSSFSGFGWIYFLYEKMNNPASSQISLLVRAHEGSYWDIVVGQGFYFWFFFCPWAVGFALFFTTLYLLRRTDLSKNNFIAVFYLTIITMGLFHFSELVMFVVLLLVISFFIPREVKLRIYESASATLLGCISIFIIQNFFFPFVGIKSTIPDYQIAILSVFSFFSWFIKRNGIYGYPLLTRVLNLLHLTNNKNIEILIIISVSFYLGGFVTWLFSVAGFSVNLVGPWVRGNIFLVPTIFYPVLLGIVGLLAIINLDVIARRYSKGTIIVFGYLSLVALISGRMCSIINVHFFDLGFNEQRFIYFVYAGLSIIASLTFSERKTLKVKQSYRRFFTSAILIGIIVMSGLTSTFLTIDFWRNHPWAKINKEDREALFNLYPDSVYSIYYTVSDESKWKLRLPASYYIEDYLSPHMWSSSYPEEALTILYGLLDYQTPRYVYLDRTDLNLINSIPEYEQGYMLQHLLDYLPQVYNKSDIDVYKVLNALPPTVNSKTVLVIPSEGDLNGIQFVYDILSLGKYNYTTMLDSDMNALESDFLIIPFDDSEAQNIMVDYLKQNANDKTLVILNTNGYGPISDLFFSKNVSYALYFDGEDDYVEVPNSASLNPSNGITLCGWIKSFGPNSNNEWQFIFCKGIRTATGEQQYAMYLSEWGGLCSWLRINGTDRFVTSPDDLRDNQWHFVATTFDGTYWKLYLDCEIIKEDNTYPGKISEINGTLNIGRLKFTPAVFNGIIDEPMIFGRALNQTEITYIFQYGKLLNASELILWLPFDEGQGEVAYDSSYCKNNGSIVGAKWVETGKLDIWSEISSVVGINGRIDLPAKILAYPILLKDDVTLLGWYENAYTNIPFAAEVNSGTKKIIYVNVYPFVETMSKFSLTRRSLYSILGELFNIIGINLSRGDNIELLITPYFTFRRALLEGDITVFSNSLTFSSKMNLSSIYIEGAGYNLFTEDVGNLTIENADNFTISLKMIEIDQGRSFYTLLGINNPEISIKGENTSISIRLQNGTIINLGRQDDIKMTIAGEGLVYVRTPLIHCIGNATFFNAYYFGPESREYLNVLRQNLYVNGNVTFHLMLIDHHGIAKDLDFKGKINIQPATLQWNELESFMKHLFFFAIFFTVFYLCYRRKYNRMQK